MPRLGLTVNDGVRSVWNGQSPFQFSPARFKFTTCPTSSTMSTRARMSSRTSAPNPAIRRLGGGLAVGPSGLSEGGHGGPPAAFRRRPGAMSGDERVRAQHVLDRAAHCPRALAVDDAHRWQSGHEGIVEILF